MCHESLSDIRNQVVLLFDFFAYLTVLPHTDARLMLNRFLLHNAVLVLPSYLDVATICMQKVWWSFISQQYIPQYLVPAIRHPACRISRAMIIWDEILDVFLMFIAGKNQSDITSLRPPLLGRAPPLLGERPALLGVGPADASSLRLGTASGHASSSGCSASELSKVSSSPAAHDSLLKGLGDLLSQFGWVCHHALGYLIFQFPGFAVNENSHAYLRIYVMNKQHRKHIWSQSLVQPM